MKTIDLRNINLNDYVPVATASKKGLFDNNDFNKLTNVCYIGSIVNAIVQIAKVTKQDNSIGGFLSINTMAGTADVFGFHVGFHSVNITPNCRVYSIKKITSLKHKFYASFINEGNTTEVILYVMIPSEYTAISRSAPFVYKATVEPMKIVDIDLTGLTEVTVI